MNSSPYAGLTNLELLRLLLEGSKLALAEVEEVKDELNRRELTDTELDELKVILEKEKQDAEELRQRVIAIYGVDHSNESKSTKRFINGVFYFFGCVCLLNSFRAFGVIRNMLMLDKAWSLHMLIELFMLIVLAVGVWQLYDRKKSGWLLFLFYLAYTVPVLFDSMFHLNEYVVHSGELMPYIFMMVAPLIVLIVQLLAYTLVGLNMVQRPILEVFGVEKELGWKVIGAGSVFSLVFVLIHLFLK